MTYTYGTSEITKKNYDVFIRRTHADWVSGPADLANFVAGVVQSNQAEYVISDWVGATSLAWVKVGKGNEKPTMKNASGQTLNLNTGDEMNISENTEINFEDLEVTSANYTELRALSNAYNVDVLFVDTPAEDGSTALGFGCADVKLSVFLEVTGNDFNKMVLQGKKESDMSTDVLLPLTCTGTDA